jgi:hypothetical protein
MAPLLAARSTLNASGPRRRRGTAQVAATRPDR